jgi:hypothetical protein
LLRVEICPLANLASDGKLEDQAADFWGKLPVEWKGGAGCHAGVFLTWIEEMKDELGKIRVSMAQHIS